MIGAAAVGEIIAQYEKHGWKLRRALLSPEARNVFANFDVGVEVIEADLDALWFSRQSQPENEAWELRRLTNLPFALVAVIRNEASEEEVEETLAQVQDEMRSKTIA